MILNVWETIKEIPENFKDWIVENGQNNPVLWTSLFILGLVVFAVTYRALSKTK